MIKYTFSTSIKPIEVYSVSKIKPKLLSEINSFVNFTLHECNHKKTHSILEQFNRLEVNTKFEVPKEFIYFLNKTIEIINVNKILHKYIKLPIKYENNLHLFDYKENILTKNIEFEIDSSISRIPFTIESIAHFMQNNKIKNILIKSSNYYFASGEKNWKLEINLDESTKISTRLRNGSISYYSRKTDIKITNKKAFALKDEPLIGEYFLIFSLSPIESKIIYELISEEFNKFKIDKILKSFNAKAKIITQEHVEVDLG